MTLDQKQDNVSSILSDDWCHQDPFGHSLRDKIDNYVVGEAASPGRSQEPQHASASNVPTMMLTKERGWQRLGLFTTNINWDQFSIYCGSLWSISGLLLDCQCANFSILTRDVWMHTLHHYIMEPRSRTNAQATCDSKPSATHIVNWRPPPHHQKPGAHRSDPMLSPSIPALGRARS